MMDFRSPKQRIGPDRRPEPPPKAIPADPAAHWRPNQRKKTRPGTTLETPGCADPRQVTHPQPQIETAHLDQQSLADIEMAPDEEPTQPSSDELMSKRWFHQLAPLPLQPSHPPPIGVHWRLVLFIFPLPIPPPPVRFRQTRAPSEWYRTLKTWSCERRVVAKVEPLETSMEK